MSPESMSIILFLTFCLGSRTIITYLSATYTEYLPIFGILALLPAFGFMYFYLSGTRKTGPEVFGKLIWWNNLRPIHSVLYSLFAFSAMSKNANAWIFLAVDVFIGFMSFVNHHFI